MACAASPLLTSPLLEAHMRFVCPECGLEHQTQPEWRKHLNEDHEYLQKTAEGLDFKVVDDRYFECNICMKWVANTQNGITLLQYHRFLHLPYSKTYRCRHCSAAFTRKRALAEHLCNLHSRYVKPSQTNDMMSTHNTSDFLSKISRNPKENAEFYMHFICPQCGKTIALFQQWLEHLETAHTSTSSDLRMHRLKNSNNNCCIICRKIFYTSEKSKLMRHRFTHLPYKLYFRCAFCPVKKAYKTEMLRHFIQVHKQEFLNCKKYVKKPVEWAAVVPESLELEMDRLMRNGNGEESNDLIKKALMASLIDLNKEMQEVNDAELKTKQRQLEQQQLKQEANVEDFCQNVLAEVERDYQSTAAPQRANVKRGAAAVQQQNSKIISLEIDKLPTGNSTKLEQPLAKRSKLEVSDESMQSSSTTAAAADTDVDKSLLEKYICYLCPECGMEFSEQAVWRRHVFQQHNIDNVVESSFKLLEDKRSYLCLTCMDVLQTRKISELQRHRFVHMPFQNYLKCTFCCKTISSKPKMLQHLRAQHAQQLQQSSRASAAATVAASRKSHLECQCCKKLFKTHLLYQQHREVCLPPPTIKKEMYGIERCKRLMEHLDRASIRIANERRRITLAQQQQQQQLQQQQQQQ